MECYLMQKARAQELAVVLGSLHPRLAGTVDAELLRMFCMAHAEEDPSVRSEWLDSAPIAEIAAWIPLEDLPGLARA
jgi:hypothetical protein